mgnify:CR=1 FL=1|nr:MAG TPA: hypothetical protein [Caudoviricetes sp.]
MLFETEAILDFNCSNLCVYSSSEMLPEVNSSTKEFTSIFKSLSYNFAPPSAESNNCLKASSI